MNQEKMLIAKGSRAREIIREIRRATRRTFSAEGEIRIFLEGLGRNPSC